MSDQIFSEARRTFEIMPGVGSLECAIGKLTAAGVDRARIRAWAASISEEYGVVSYVRRVLDRLKSRG
jgi:hypothetical protein